MIASLGVAAGLGAVTGLRSMQALAHVSRTLSRRRGRLRRTPPPESWLGNPAVSRILAVLAAGELVVDKLPAVPDRTDPGSLLGREAIGALVGAVAAGPDHRWAGAVAGAAGAMIGAFAGFHLRREAVRLTLLPDPAIALVEDALAVAAARELASEV